MNETALLRYLVVQNYHASGQVQRPQLRLVDPSTDDEPRPSWERTSQSDAA